MKTAKENLYDTLKGKKVIFLENGTDKYLDNGLQNVEAFLKEKKIKYKIWNVDPEVNSFEKTLLQIKKHDAIIFQSQWLYDISKKLNLYMRESKEKKIIIEVYVGCDPTWYYHPEGVVHDVYILPAPLERTYPREWRFYKLSDKAYWNYENEFDN